MAGFDFIEAGVQGYRFFGREYPKILKYATIPIAVKVLAMGFILAIGLEENFLRQGLILLPSYFVEGWLVAYLIQSAVLSQEWPEQQKSHFTASFDAKDTERLLMGGAVIYTLVKLLIAFFTGLVFEAMNLPGAMEVETEPDPNVFLSALFLLVFMVWLFRFTWAYVPVCLGYSVRFFVCRTHGFATSFFMLGTWVLVFVPMTLTFIFTAEILGGLFNAAEGEPTTIYRALLLVAQAILETLLAVVSSVAMTYGILSIFNDDKQGRLF